MMDFEEFPKMARLSREVIVTEKIDGTNAQIFITEDGQIRAGSRTRWITPADDNFGFAAWVEEHRDELLTLAVRRRYGATEYLPAIDDKTERRAHASATAVAERRARKPASSTNSIR